MRERSDRGSSRGGVHRHRGDRSPDDRGDRRIRTEAERHSHGSSSRGSIESRRDYGRDRHRDHGRYDRDRHDHRESYGKRYDSRHYGSRHHDWRRPSHDHYRGQSRYWRPSRHHLGSWHHDHWSLYCGHYHDHRGAYFTSPRFQIPRWISVDVRPQWDPYYYGEVWHAGHGHVHVVYVFPDYGWGGVDWVPYSYCGTGLYARGTFGAGGLSFGVQLRF